MSNQSERVFDALGEPARRRILEILQEGPTPVGKLAERLPIGRPAVSKHLRVLSGAGLIEHHSVGTRNLYALAPGGLGAAQVWLTRTWDTVLNEYAAEVARVAAASSTPAPATPLAPESTPASPTTVKPRRRSRS